MTYSKSSNSSYNALVEDHAAQLIDQLFQDIEQELDGNQTQPIAKQNGSTSTGLLRLSPQINSPEEEFGLLVPYEEMDATLESFYDPKPAQRFSGMVPEESKHSDHSNPSFTQGLLLGITCLTFVGSLGLWIATQFMSHSSTPPVTAQTVPSASPSINPVDVAFANEMEESFKAAQSVPVALATSPVLATTALPSITSANVSSANITLTAAAPQVSGSIVPSTQTQVQPNAIQPNAIPKLKATQVTPPSIKMQPLPPAALPSLQPIALNTVGQSKTPLLTPPKLSLNPSASSVSSPTVSSFVPQALPLSRKGKVGVTVQGILDLGDKSAMLIARNGSTQNIKPGEVLDSSGWVFLRVERGQAIIQRGNEVRSVSSGEEF